MGILHLGNCSLEKEKGAGREGEGRTEEEVRTAEVKESLDDAENEENPGGKETERRTEEALGRIELYEKL